MRIFKYRYFQQWSKLERLSDDVLKKAVDEIASGLFEANLGGGLYKKRVAIKGRGKRAGYRVLLAFKQEQQAIFIYGYAKNVKANINLKEQVVFKDLAKILLNLDDQAKHKMLKVGKLIEVK